jgi:PTS system ascorbate-specific IIA component
LVGILLVAHNQLGECFADCARHVYTILPKNLMVLTVLAKDDPAELLMEGQTLIKQLDSGSGVLILTDVLGATPSNIARQLCNNDHVMGVAGLNLPMLLRVLCAKNKTLPELAHIAVEGGRECIVHMEHDHDKHGNNPRSPKCCNKIH